jgi:hypothetical protein
VSEVRVDDDTALVIFDDESVLEVSPPDGDGRGLAAAIERAVESGPHRLEGPGVQDRVSWAAFVFAAGAVTLVAAWLTHWLA